MLKNHFIDLLKNQQESRHCDSARASMLPVSEIPGAERRGSLKTLIFSRYYRHGRRDSGLNKSILPFGPDANIA
jgi:hypothetical protein